MDRYAFMVFGLFFLFFMAIFSFYDFSGITSATTFSVGEDIPLINPPDSVVQAQENEDTGEPETETEQDVQEDPMENFTVGNIEVDDVLDVAAQNIQNSDEELEIQTPKKKTSFVWIIAFVLVPSVIAVLVYEFHFRKSVRPAHRHMDELKKYFEEGIKKGYTVAQLRDALVKQGVSEHQIEVFINNFGKF